MLPHVLCEQVSFTSQLGLLGRGKWACLFVYLDVYLRSHVGVVFFPSGHAHSSRGGGILHIFVIGSGEMYIRVMSLRPNFIVLFMTLIKIRLRGGKKERFYVLEGIHI